MGKAGKGEYVGAVKRFVAYWIDFLILFAVFLVIQYFQKAAGGASLISLFSAKSMADIAQMTSTPTQPSQTVTAFDQVKGLGVMIGWLTWPGLVYTLGMWILVDGATVGKKILGIKITKADGSKLDAPTAIKRYLASLLTILTLPLLGIGYLWSLWDGKRQMLHDKLAQTVVVRTEKKSRGFLGVLLALLGMLAIPGLIVAVFVKGYRLSKASMPIQYKRLDELKGEAKSLWKEGEALRQQIGDNWDNKEEVKKLNNQYINKLREILKLTPNNSMVISELGIAYGWPTDEPEASPQKSLELFRQALEIDPEAVYYSNLVADQLLRLRRYQEAVAQFEQSVAIDDQDPTAHYGLGLASQAVGNKSRAKEELTKAKELFTAANQEGQYDQKIADIDQRLSGL